MHGRSLVRPHMPAESEEELREGLEGLQLQCCSVKHELSHRTARTAVALAGPQLL